MRNHHLRSVPALIGCLLAACGGGGGQGGDFGTGLAIDVSTLSFSGMANEPPPPIQTVLATISAIDAAALAVGYTAGNDQVPWLQATIDTTHKPAAVKFNVTLLSSPGTYTARPSIGIFRSDGTPIAIRTLTVTYQVLPQTPGVSTNSVAMTTQVNNPAPQRYLVTVKGSGTWVATVDYASGAGWLTLSGSTTFPHNGSGTFFELWPASTTPVGSYSATLHVAIGGQTFDIAVTLHVVP